MRLVGFARIAPAALALLTGWGCGQSSAPHVGATLPVTGKILLNGRPLKTGRVKFEPEGPGREAQGDIKPDGTFVLTTYAPADGAVGGIHRISVDGRVPVKYRNPSSSKVQVEIVAGTSQYEINLP